MKMRRTFFTPMALSFLVAVAGQTLWLADAVAQTLVPIKGVVAGTLENVSFSGQAKVTSRLAPDPDFNKPMLVLTIDLVGVPGVGASSKAKYVISGPANVQRLHAISQAVAITFPFASASNGTVAGRGLASFALNIDLATGAITGASGSVGTPTFPQ